MFSVSGLPKSDFVSGSDKILLKIDSGVNLILSSSSIFTTYDGLLITLSPIKTCPCDIACLAWYGVLKKNFLKTIVWNLLANKFSISKFRTSSNVAVFSTSPIRDNECIRIGSSFSLTSCLTASKERA